VKRPFVSTSSDFFFRNPSFSHRRLVHYCDEGVKIPVFCVDPL
jgi:hypothetical protein